MGKGKKEFVRDLKRAIIPRVSSVLLSLLTVLVQLIRAVENRKTILHLCSNVKMPEKMHCDL